MEKDYLEFIENIKTEYNFDLDNYKEAQMQRRLKSLYEKKGCKDFKEYYRCIKNDAIIREEFFDRVTINVTEFFRNKERWMDLAEMIKDRKSIKVLSAACSTGEEVYTMKLLAEMLGISIEVIGIDIDKNSIEKAKEAIYPEISIKVFEKKELEKHFEEVVVKKMNYTEKGYKLKDEIKKNVRFERKDLFEDDIEGENNIVICRNVMIYFKEDAKEGLYLKLNKALKENGILFVGSSEQIFKPEKYGFEMIKPFFYKKIGQGEKR